MTPTEIKLKCLEIAATAKAQSGLYATSAAITDARRFFGWVTEGTSDQPADATPVTEQESPKPETKKHK